MRTNYTCTADNTFYDQYIYEYINCIHYSEHIVYILYTSQFLNVFLYSYLIKLTL